MKEKAKDCYDCREEYDNEIKEHVKSIMLLCDKYKIPMFMTFAVANTATTTEYVSEMLSKTMQDRELKKDLIAKHALIMSGFEVRETAQFSLGKGSDIPIIEEMTVLDDGDGNL